MFSLNPKLVYLILWIVSLLALILYLLIVEYLHEEMKKYTDGLRVKILPAKKRQWTGVKSGQYYAAIVVPEKFSTQMMSLFSDQIQKAGNYLLFQRKGKCDCTKSDRQGCNRDPETGESGIYTDNIRHGNDGVSVGL